MGTLTLSGVLKRPVSGDVVPNARIIFDAIATGTVVLKGVSSSCKTAADGSYSVELEYGDYAIQVSWSGQTQQYGTVHIDDTTPIGSLNDLLMQELMESQLTPEIVLEFRQLQQEMQEDLAEMEGLNTEASTSASAAGTSAAAAGVSEDNSAASASDSAGSAALSKQYAESISGDADAAADSAAAAAISETNSAASEAAAAGSASAAKTSETNSAASETAAAGSALAAKTSETNSAASEAAAAGSASAANTSETNSAASASSAATSETNAKNARDAAEEYAQEAKDASSKVTAPLTDQGLWAIQSGYPVTPTAASVWQVTDGGVDPVNSDIIWDPGDMLVYLASSGSWCRILGQQTVAGEPKALTFDADIILNVGAGLQIITSGTTAVDVARLDADNYLMLGDSVVPGICLTATDPTNMFVMVPDGNGGYIKSRIYSEQYKPTVDALGFGSAATADVVTSATDTTVGRALTVGYQGMGGVAVETDDATLNQKTGLATRIFRQGGGSEDIHFGSYGAGLHIYYGSNSEDDVLYSRLFVRGDGIAFSEFTTLNEDGSVKTDYLNTLFGTLNPPTAEQTGALPLTGGTLTGALTLSEWGATINLAPAADGDYQHQFIRAYSDPDLETPLWLIGRESDDAGSVDFKSYTDAVITLKDDGHIQLIPSTSNFHVVFGDNPKTLAGVVQAVAGSNYGSCFVATNDTITESGTTTGGVIISQNTNKGWEVRLYVDGDVGGDEFAGIINVATNDNSLQKSFAFHSDGTFVPATYSNFDARYVSGVQLGAAKSMSKVNEYGSGTAPTGCLLCAVQGDPSDNYGTSSTCKPVQQNINGTYVTISG